MTPKKRMILNERRKEELAGPEYTKYSFIHAEEIHGVMIDDFNLRSIINFHYLISFSKRMQLTTHFVILFDMSPIKRHIAILFSFVLEEVIARYQIEYSSIIMEG